MLGGGNEMGRFASALKPDQRAADVSSPGSLAVPITHTYTHILLHSTHTPAAQEPARLTGGPGRLHLLASAVPADLYKLFPD